MSQSKQIFEDMNQQEEQLIPVEEQQPTAREILIEKIRNKTLRLSFSSLKSFTSPKEFLDYKLKKFETNKGMDFGSLCHILILQPHLFEEKFAIVKKLPSEGNQTGFSRDYLAGIPVDTAYANNYKTGTYEKIYAELKDYFTAKQSDKQIIDQQTYDNAKKLTDYLIETPLFQKYLTALSDVEVEVKWTVNGWIFKGFIDAQGTGFKFDLKYTKNANPDAFERDIVKMKYYMQGGMYDDATPDQLDKYVIIAFDAKGNFCDIVIDRYFIEYGKREYKYLVSMLEKCAREERWDESYNFFDHSQRTLHKPKYLKGFATDPDDID
jgi:hypothetical protein